MTIGAAHPPAVGVEHVDAALVQGEGDAGADIDLGHAEAFGHRDEGTLGAGVEVEQRILAERLDQAHRQLGLAFAAKRNADMLRPDAERGVAGFRRL